MTPPNRVWKTFLRLIEGLPDWKQMTARDLARLTGTSEAYLCRLCKQNTGHTLTEFKGRRHGRDITATEAVDRFEAYMLTTPNWHRHNMRDICTRVIGCDTSTLRKALRDLRHTTFTELVWAAQGSDPRTKVKLRNDARKRFDRFMEMAGKEMPRYSRLCEIREALGVTHTTLNTYCRRAWGCTSTGQTEVRRGRAAGKWALFLEYIEGKDADRLTVETIARAVGLTTITAKRYYEKHFGRPAPRLETPALQRRKAAARRDAETAHTRTNGEKTEDGVTVPTGNGTTRSSSTNRMGNHQLSPRSRARGLVQKHTKGALKRMIAREEIDAGVADHLKRMWAEGY